MAEILATLAAPWADGSSILSDLVRVVWGEGASVYSLGGTYTPSSPPASGTTTAPNLTARTAVAAASAYNQVPSYTVTDLRDGQPVPVDTVSFSTDEDALFWALSLTGGQSLYDKLKAGAQPATVAVVLNGEEWRFVIEDVPRQRRHGEATVRASGRSLTCLAGAPYEFEQNWSLDGDTTALQLAAAANANTGLQIEWGLVDWPIPDGVFSHTGTPLSVVKRVADAVGAMVQSDPKEFTVRVLPRYDLLPNEWPKVAPDAQLAEAALESEGYENTNQPAYDGVYVLGQQGGAAAFVRLAGTSGANLKPMVTDALLTDLVACQQRGMAELGRSGEQQRHTLTLPVYSGAGEPHVHRVGKIVKVMETAPWWGVVRSVAVQAQFGDVSQTVAVERHTRLIDGTTFDPNAPTPLRFVGTIPAQAMTAGASFVLDLSAYFVDGVAPYRYSMRSGTLPGWMSLHQDTGLVSGTVPGSMAAVGLQFRCTDNVSSTADTNEVIFSIAGGAAIGLFGTSDQSARAPSVGAAFTTYNTGAFGIARQAASAGGNLIVAGTGGVSRSTDQGVTWASTGIGVVTVGYGAAIDNLVWTGTEFLFLFCASGSFFHRVSATGASWSTRSYTAPTSHDRVVSVRMLNGRIYAAFVDPFIDPFGDITTTVEYSVDGGSTWSGPVLTDVSGFAFNPQMLFGGGRYVLVSGQDLRWSASGAGSWTSVSLAYEATLLLSDGAKFVAWDSGSWRIGTSTDAASWSWGTPIGSAAPNEVPIRFLFDGANYILVFRNVVTGACSLRYSSNLTAWTTVAGPAIDPRTAALLS